MHVICPPKTWEKLERGISGIRYARYHTYQVEKYELNNRISIPVAFARSRSRYFTNKYLIKKLKKVNCSSKRQMC